MGLAKAGAQRRWSLPKSPSQLGQRRAQAHVRTPCPGTSEGLEVGPPASERAPLCTDQGGPPEYEGPAAGPHRRSEPQFPHVAGEGGSVCHPGLIEALRRKQGTYPSPVPGFGGGGPRLCERRRWGAWSTCAGSFYAPALSRFWGAGGAGPLCSFGVLSASLSLGLPFFILQAAVTAWLLCVECAGLAHSRGWVKRDAPPFPLPRAHVTAL